MGKSLMSTGRKTTYRLQKVVVQNEVSIYYACVKGLSYEAIHAAGESPPTLSLIFGFLSCFRGDAVDSITC